MKATHSWEPRFEGAPFELWVGGDAPVGTSVGQVRVVDMQGAELLFDMFHSYPDGGVSSAESLICFIILSLVIHLYDEHLGGNTVWILSQEGKDFKLQGDFM